MEYEITQQQIDQYCLWLLREEYAAHTAEKYIRDIRRFAAWLGARPAKKERAAEWKDSLLKAGYAPATVNSMLSALNGFFHFLGWDMFRVKFLKIQRRMFREPAKELSRHEYDRLFQAASCGGKGRLALLMETICATGIRVSEVRYITVEAGKVYPHNLRHLFARAFYRVTRDVVQLADVLGHSNVETTRLYLISTGSEHGRQLERLGLVT